MKLVMTLVVRDEADIIDKHLAYHLGAGVDFMIATDHRSQDGTTEILESYARAGVLYLIREEGEFVRQGAWQTQMARLAATEHGADWVINSDADEFWWPRGPSLKEVLDAVPRRYGAACGLVRNFIPRREDGGRYTEQLTVRLAAPAPINDPATPFRPVVKVAHRGHPGVVVGGGSNRVFGLQLPVFNAWYPFEVLHIPLRSREQCAHKYRKTWAGWEENLRGDLARARQASEQGRPDPLWDRVTLDDPQLERGLTAGWLVADTRLRDAFRLLRDEDGISPTSAFSNQRRTALPERAELDAHALDVTVFEEAELVRRKRRMDEIEARVLRLEHATKTRKLGSP
jgi:hypothetical protein